MIKSSVYFSGLLIIATDANSQKSNKLRGSADLNLLEIRMVISHLLRIRCQVIASLDWGIKYDILSPFQKLHLSDSFYFHLQVWHCECWKHRKDIYFGFPLREKEAFWN